MRNKRELQQIWAKLNAKQINDREFNPEKWHKRHLKKLGLAAEKFKKMVYKGEITDAQVVGGVTEQNQ